MCVIPFLRRVASTQVTIIIFDFQREMRRYWSVEYEASCIIYLSSVSMWDISLKRFYKSFVILLTFFLSLEYSQDELRLA